MKCIFTTLLCPAAFNALWACAVLLAEDRHQADDDDGNALLAIQSTL